MTDESFAQKLYKLRMRPCCSLPDKKEVRKLAEEILRLLFPHFSVKNYSSPQDISDELEQLEFDLCHILKPFQNLLKKNAKEIAQAFFDSIPEIHANLISDAEAIYQGDPAAKNVDEVILTYPGFLAIAIFRIAHEFHNLEVPYFPRVLTEYAHSSTGIDIHPGASIGKSFCIDHGTGIVIGETTVIGNNVKLYQGVTLGALSVNKSLADLKRHPTIEDNTIIYSGATILGGKTVVGHDSVIGGNVWLTTSVEPYSILYNKSEIRVGNAVLNKEPINFSI